ncbi:MAG: hypothetical protein K6A35_05960 [bacterium]|nr:hypothetical protein [bacterium]
MQSNFLGRYAPSSWRYILDPALSGQANMDRDYRLMEECCQPTLRLYAWERPTLSLGRNQRDNWIDRALCQEHDVEVVRRPTGGRALLHMPSEITYAVILPQVGEVGVQQAFTDIAWVLAQALLRLGLPVTPATSGHIPGSASHPSCMAVTAPGEVTVNGRKFVGSAQVRHEGNLLQHGVIVRCYDRELLQLLIPGAEPGVDLQELGFAELKPEQIVSAWQKVLAENFG